MSNLNDSTAALGRALNEWKDAGAPVIDVIVALSDYVKAAASSKCSHCGIEHYPQWHRELVDSMSTTLKIDDIVRDLFRNPQPDTPRLRYVVADALYDAMVEQFKGFPVDVIRLSDTRLPNSVFPGVDPKTSRGVV